MQISGRSLGFGFDSEVLRLNSPVFCSPLSRGQAFAFLLSCIYFFVDHVGCDGGGEAVVDVDGADAGGAAQHHSKLDQRTHRHPERSRGVYLTNPRSGSS